MLNRAKEYYKHDKERLTEHTENSLRKKKTKREYGRNRYKNMSEENKKRLKE